MRTILILIAVLLIWAVPQPLADTNRQICPCEFVAPIYPALARLSRTQGDVTIKASIDSSGHPVEIEVVQDTAKHSPTAEILERAAVNAMQKWRFCLTPSMNQKTVVVIFKFRLLVDATPRNADQWFPTDVSYQLPGTVEIMTTTPTIRTD